MGGMGGLVGDLGNLGLGGGGGGMGGGSSSSALKKEERVIWQGVGDDLGIEAVAWRGGLVAWADSRCVVRVSCRKYVAWLWLCWELRVILGL